MDNIYVRKITGYLLYIISCYFSVKLFSQFAESGLDSIVWALCGIAYMTTELLVSCAGIRFFYQKRFVMMALCGMFFLFLYAISVVGSIGFQSASSHDAAVSAGKTDANLTRMDNQLKSIETSIRQTEEQINELTKRLALTKGVTPARAQLDSLREEKAQLLKDIQNYKPESGGANAFWTELAKFLGAENPETVKFQVFLLIAFLLDLSAAFLLMIDFNPENIDNEPVRSRGAFQKTLAGQGFTQPVLTGGGAIAKSDDAENQFQAWAEQHQHMEEERRKQLEQQNALFMQMLKRLENQQPVHQPAMAQGLGFTAPTQEFKEFKDVSITGKEPTSKDFTVTSKESTSKNFKNLTVTGKDFIPVTINHDTLTKYVDVLFSKTKTDGSLLGRNAIADEIGISYKEAAVIHNFLKKSGFITVNGNATYPVYAQEQILAEISNGNGGTNHDNEIRT